MPGPQALPDQVVDPVLGECAGQLLLRRCAELLAPAGTVLAECDPPGAGLWCGESWLRYDSGDSAPFRWARVGADQLTRLVATLPLRPTGGFHRAGRWFVELERR